MTASAIRRNWFRWLLVAATASSIALAWWAYRSTIGATDDELLAQADEALQAKKYSWVEGVCQRLLSRDPRSVRALKVAAEAAEKSGRREAALDFLERIDDDDRRQMAVVSLNCGRLALELKRLASAERHYTRALEFSPDNLKARQDLIYILRIEGRNWEAQAHIRELLKTGKQSGDHLYVLGSTEWVWLDSRDSQFLELAVVEVFDDPLPRLGQARQALFREEYDRSFGAFQQIVAVHPEILEAQARLGATILQLAGPRELLEWNRRLPLGADAFPEIWFVRGLWARQAGDPRGAIACLGKCVSLDSNHRGANYQLSQLLQATDDAQQAVIFAERALRLGRVEYLVREVQHSPKFMHELTELLEDLDRPREAAAWVKLALNSNPNQQWAHVAATRLKEYLAGSSSIALSGMPGDSVDWSKYARPILDDLADFTALRSETKPSGETGRMAFVDAAPAAGIAFKYENGADSAAKRAFMFEFSGGGAAVLDYDADGWPDLYLTQGGRWPASASIQNSTDRVFRNLGTGQFQDRTAAAGLKDTLFSQGATVGDFDNDGFADLYVVNIGPNRFYRNNGDGTFDDVTDSTGTAGDDWSLSAALADLNGDALPDLYVVNYLGGDVLERACNHHGRPVQCFPVSFPAQQDRLYINLGDGSFRDVTSQSGIECPDGKGMGIVVADLDGSRRLSVFVANDTTANFLFRNETPAPGDLPRFAERGVLSGVAFDERGVPQSSMGVAAGDVDGDGLIDLFVTNYLRESSNLFVQRPDHTFGDAAASAGLREPSINKMKWGTQWLDVDLDGNLDLIVANGHLDDYSSEGIPYRMPTQCFRNLGAGRLIEVPAKGLGPYFERDVLGRAVARLDWNRDGLEDFCVTHVDAPFALLTNRTASPGHSLRLTLRGIDSSRDAIGTTVRVVIGGRVLTRQLTAGDGFAASNERRMVIGLGESVQADSLTVAWPAGGEQAFSNLSADREWLILEGRPQPISLPAP